jgi:hypothetical protein
MIVGDGKNTPFGESRWLNGASPKELAPNLYQVTRFKNRNIHAELRNCNWIRSLGPIQSTNLLEEFTLLFMVLSSVELSQEKDIVKWRWTSGGDFSMASAYSC